MEPAGAEACPHIAGVWSIEVSPGVAKQPRLGCPGTTAQHLVRTKPGLGVFAIGIHLEAWIGFEIVSYPFPHVADHLTATERAVAGCKSSHVRRASGAATKVGLLRAWRRISPGKVTFALGPNTAQRLSRRRNFPFGFCREAPSCPIAIGFRLPPVHVQHWTMWLEVQPAVKIAPQPAPAAFTMPIRRMFRSRALPPTPAAFAPELSLPITTCVHKVLKLALRNWSPRNGKGTNVNRVRPFLIVENEGFSRHCPEQKGTAGNFCIAVEGACVHFSVGSWRATRPWCRIAVRLPRVSEGLVVHVFVEDTELDEVTIVAIEIAGFDSLQDRIAHRREIRQGILTRRKQQVPAGIVSDSG